MIDLVEKLSETAKTKKVWEVKLNYFVKDEDAINDKNSLLKNNTSLYISSDSVESLIRKLRGKFRKIEEIIDFEIIDIISHVEEGVFIL